MDMIPSGTALAEPDRTLPAGWLRTLDGLGARLRAAREQAGMSQAELGRRTGRDTRTIQRYESGDVLPPLTVLVHLAGVLNTLVADLLGDVPSS
jgi:transcriptional regulator with XRE-family HTH domain